MIKLSKLNKILSINLAVFGLAILGGFTVEINAQTRDPFQKPGWARTRDPRPSGTAQAKKETAAPVESLVPSIEQRIAYYKQLRENAAANGEALPKVTSVLTLNEMAVTGIFKTPRGYAAMVEATPIKLSYTIYPGERFFDGQLVAVEENRLVFRKVTKMSNGKFVSSVENKSLRLYSDQAQIQGTAPAQAAAGQTSMPASVDGKPAPVQVISPLDEMNRQPAETDSSAKGKPSKNTKRPVRVARNKK